MDLLYDPPQRPLLALSPDGKQLAYAGSSEGRRLYLQDLTEIAPAHPIGGTEGAISPFFSPDSRSVAFFADNKLETITLGGGAPRALADVTALFRGGAWSTGGDFIYYSPGVAGGIWKVATTGGSPEQITTPERQYRLVPDGVHSTEVPGR